MASNGKQKWQVKQDIFHLFFKDSSISVLSAFLLSTGKGRTAWTTPTGHTGPQQFVHIKHYQVSLACFLSSF